MWIKAGKDISSSSSSPASSSTASAWAPRPCWSASDGTPLHTFYARADTLGGVFDDGTKFHRVRLALERPPEWWGKVDAIVFFNMTYHPIQKLDDDGVWAAMQRAVWHFTNGQGTEQRG